MCFSPVIRNCYNRIAYYLNALMITGGTKCEAFHEWREQLRIAKEDMAVPIWILLCTDKHRPSSLLVLAS
jgi:hypothetical protein